LRSSIPEALTHAPDQILKLFGYIPKLAQESLFGGIENCRKSIKKKRDVLFNTALFFLIDLRRFEPAQKPILELTSV